MGKLMLNDVCYSSGGSGQVFTGATATTAGTQGEVPAPAAGDQAKYLRADGNWATPPGSGGSTVIITPTLSSGTKVADYEIDGVAGSLYAPNGGGSTVSVTQKTSSGTNIASITIDGVVTELYAPNGGGASALEDLTDVDITTPTDGQALVYDATNDKWINGTVQGAGGHMDTLWTGSETPTMSYSPTITLLHPISDYDFLLVNFNIDNGAGNHLKTTVTLYGVTVGDKFAQEFLLAQNSAMCVNVINDYNINLECYGRSYENTTYMSIIGVKL